jgi:hypothetical protein
LRRDGGLEVGKIDRLGDKVEGAAVHRGADVRHFAIGRDDHRGGVSFALMQVGQQGQSVHSWHIDVAQKHVDVAAGIKLRQRIHAIIHEDEAKLSIGDLPAELLNDRQFQIRFVIDDKDARHHPPP